MRITGMTCASCSNALEKALKALGGVQSASVALTLEQAEVTFDPSLVTEVGFLDLHGLLPLFSCVSGALMRGSNPAVSQQGANSNPPQQSPCCGSDSALREATLYVMDIHLVHTARRSAIYQPCLALQGPAPRRRAC